MYFFLKTKHSDYEINSFLLNILMKPEEQVRLFFFKKKIIEKLFLCAYKRTPRLYYNDTLTVPTLQKTDPNLHPKNSFYLISTIHYFFHHY